MSQNEQIDIRKATLTDASSIAVVQVEAWQAAYVGMIPDEVLEALTVASRTDRWKQILTEGSGTTLVASADQEIAAWSGFGDSRDEDRTTNTGEVYGFYVAPRYWRQGVGKALWQETVARTRSRGLASADVWVLSANQHARKFYEAMGCQLDGNASKAFEVHGHSIPEVRYSLDL